MAKELWSLEVRDIREHGLGKHRTVDDTPAGGGPGMVMRPDVAAAALDAARAAGRERPSLYLTPRGAPLTQERVKTLARGPGVILLCGRFEGLDERAIEARALEEVSLGDYVLAGGEIAAMALIEAAVRLIPGVLGDRASPAEESFEAGLLEYPQYTRPQTFEGREFPPSSPQVIMPQSQAGGRRRPRHSPDFAVPTSGPSMKSAKGRL